MSAEMTMTNVRVLRQVEISAPQAFAEAVTPALFTRLRLTAIPALFIRPQQDNRSFRWMGFCASEEFTESGEITLDARCVETAEWEPRADLIQGLYLHEAAHRLMPGHRHNAAFGALVLLLYLRTGVTNHIEMWQRSTLYDFRDEAENLPRAFAWAWRMAHELAATGETAEQCAKVISEQYATWRVRLADELAQRQVKRDAEIVERKALEDRIKSMRENLWLWALAGFIVGVIGVLLALQ
jgi:hypothetical protein